MNQKCLNLCIRFQCCWYLPSHAMHGIFFFKNAFQRVNAIRMHVDIFWIVSCARYGSLLAKITKTSRSAIEKTNRLCERMRTLSQLKTLLKATWIADLSCWPFLCFGERTPNEHVSAVPRSKLCPPDIISRKQLLCRSLWSSCIHFLFLSF